MRKLRILFLVGLILFVLCSCDKKREVALVQNKQTVKGVSLNKNRTIYGIDDKIIPEDSRLLKAIFYNKSNLLVITQNEEDTIILRLYDIYTGRIRSGCMIQNGDSSLAAECFVTDTFQTVIRSEDHNRFFIFDKSFRLILSDHDLPKQVTSIVVSRDGESVYYIKENGKGIYQYDRKSRQSKLKMQLSMEDKVKISLDEVSRDGRYLSAHYEKGEIDSGEMIIQLNTKEVNYYERQYDSVHIVENTLYYCDETMKESGTVTTCNLKKQLVRTDLSFAKKQEAQCFTGCPLGKGIISIQGGNKKPGVFQVYDLEKGGLWRQSHMDAEKYIAYIGEKRNLNFSFLGWSDISYNVNNGVACINYWENEQKKCLLWEVSKEEDYVTKEGKLRLDTSCEVKAENERLVSRLERIYHIEIYTKDNAVRYFKEFAVTPLEEEDKLNCALKKLEETLNKLPEQLMQEFQYGSVKGVEVYLCKTILTPFSYQISNAAGFADVIDHKQVIVLACDNLSEIETCFAHEFMHGLERIIEYKIDHKKVSKEILKNWNSLSPKDSYCYHYVTKSGEDVSAENTRKYTPYEEASDYSNVYFVDAYSRTYPAEDRARIFESLVTANKELPVYFKSKHLSKKAKYLCDLIRKSFPELEGKSLYWEQWQFNVVN